MLESVCLPLKILDTGHPPFLFAIALQTSDGRADMTNFEMDLFDTRINSYNLDKEETDTCCRNSCIRPACFPICVIALFIFMVVRTMKMSASSSVAIY
jgi:hypothetical protein